MKIHNHPHSIINSCARTMHFPHIYSYTDTRKCEDTLNVVMF